MIVNIFLHLLLPKVNFERDKYQSGICNLCEMLRGSSYGEQFYADNERYFSRDMLQGPSSYNKSNPFCRFWACIYEKDIRLRKDDTIPYRVIESLRRVRVLLENALLSKKGDHLIVFFFTYYFSKLSKTKKLELLQAFLCEPI